MHFCYIIHSPGHDRFYIGETEDMAQRLDAHNTGAFKGSSTTFANDWECFLVLECEDRAHARRMESFLKRMRNRSFYERLKRDGELRGSILKRFK